MTRRTATALTAAVALATAAPALADPETGDDRESYSYVRTLEGNATLASSTRAPGEPAGVNEPLLQGDQVRVESGARLEIVLADRNLLRIGGGSTLRLVRVAFSADRDDRTTRLDLDEGEILLDVTDEALGDELPEVRTPSGTVYVHQPGRYRIAVDAGGALLVAVRQGYAELLTERGSTVVRTGEEAWTTGDSWGSVEVTDAGPRGQLERWADDLEERIDRASRRELRVEPYLAYSAASLDDYGSWVYVDASWYWRPRASFGWRPYWDGRWAWTPSGLTWVSYEPWGWVPYHYGSWAVVPGYGWCWRPGALYSPAWVYWYVGPSWTGWCPVGYYTHHYRNFWHTGFRFGIYGWTRGSWGFYSDWCFLPTHRLFVRHGGDWRRTGSHLGRTEGGEVPPGILTTDTGGLPREGWERPGGAVRELERRAGPRFGREDGRLPEVTEFVARRPSLPPTVERVVVRDPAPRGERRASPLDPGAAPAAPGERGERAAEWRRRAPSDTGDDAGARVGGGRRADLSGSPPDGRLRGGFGRGPIDGRGDAVAGGRFDGGATDTNENWRRRDASVSERSAPSPRDGGEPTAVDRQGWRRTTGGATSDGMWRGPSTRPATSEPPVSRVIGGLRRAPTWDGGVGDERGASQGRGISAGERGAASDFESPPSSPSGRRSPYAAAPPAGWRGGAGDLAPRYGAPPQAAPSGPASSARVSPSAPPASRGVAAPSASSANRGSGRPPTASARGTQGSGSGRSHASSSRGGSKPSPSSSSPPPKRQKPPRDDR
jgi:hypothetical protein